MGECGDGLSFTRAGRFFRRLNFGGRKGVAFGCVQFCEAGCALDVSEMIGWE